MEHAFTALVLAAAAGTLSVITSQAEITRPCRVWLASRKTGAGQWFFKLASCPFCTAVWLCLAAAAVYRPLLVRLWWPLDYLVTALAMAGAAMGAVLVIRAALRR